MKKIMNEQFMGEQTITLGIRTHFIEAPARMDGFVTPDLESDIVWIPSEKSILESVRLILSVDDVLMRDQLFDSRNGLNDDGQETITNTLIAGIVEHIVSCDVAGIRRWQNHFDYFLNRVAEGLSHRLAPGALNLDATTDEETQQI